MFRILIVSIPIINYIPVILKFSRLISLELWVVPICRTCIEICIKRPHERFLALEIMLNGTLCHNILIRKKAINAVGVCEKISECWIVIKSTTMKRIYKICYTLNQKISYENENYDKDNSLIDPKTITQEETQIYYCLYLVLCGRDPFLITYIYDIYKEVGKKIRKFIEKQTDKITKIIGISAKPLLQVMDAPPFGTHDLLFHMIKEYVSQENIPTAIMTMLKTTFLKTKDFRFLTIVLPLMTKDEITSNIVYLIQVENSKLREYVSYVCENKRKHSILPSDLMFALQKAEFIDIPKKKRQMEIIDYFLKELNDIFTPSVIATALELLIHIKPLPLFFMRTIIQSIKLAEAERPFLTTYTIRWITLLIKNQIWKDKIQWNGLAILADLIGEQTFPLIMKLPPSEVTNLMANKDSLRHRFITFTTNSINKNIATSLTHLVKKSK
jgi:hypothetical protein